MGEEIVDRSEGFGERLLGVLLDRARLLPPQLIAPLIAEEVARIGGRDVSILLQDYARELLVLPGRKLHVGQPEPMTDSPAGRAFLRGDVVEVPQARGGVRIHLALLDGSDQVGVMALPPDTVQWGLLPPLTMAVPQVQVAGILEPAHRAAGDSFDYVLNDNILHVAVIDAMGHDMDAAAMATIAIGACRHARRAFKEHPLQRGDRVLCYTDDITCAGSPTR
ncbi:hypothetical protein ADL12_23805 [Streptomyces regalis]|uniref:PPM-type phosphatase domain-containing protein n=1 Tax=Streptomyces regalis TaxID=68262 RepID=A0A124GAH2_9ACTN|nr:hypothetical protein ADL12_23805 [Streptomyces regalis]